MATDPPVYRPADDDDQTPELESAGGEPTRQPWRRIPRRLVFLLIVILVGCVGAPVVIGVGWIVGQTAKASKGAATPTVALLEWMYSFADPNDVTADRYVSSGHRGELDKIRAKFVADMTTTGPGTKLAIASADSAETITGDMATVTDSYSATLPGSHGELLGGWRTQALPWHATARREDDGWRLTSAEIPPWCGPGGYVKKCGPLDVPDPSASASPSPSPSDDLLKNPREMLPCGPRDPFPQYHSCPPSKHPR